MLAAAVLALIHGIAVFLPISADVHRRVLTAFLGIDPPPTVEAGLELGSLIALVLFFGADWLQIVANTFGVQVGRDPELRRTRGMFPMLIAASAPLALTGFWFTPGAGSALFSPYVAAVLLVVVGLAMGWAEHSAHRQKAIDHLSFADAMLIGVVQSLAVLPGTSRMALALTASLLLNFDRVGATRISYLLAMPVVAGRTLLMFRDLAAAKGFAGTDMLPFATAALVCAIASIATMALFTEFASQSSLRPFARYRMGFGVVVLGLAVALG